MKAHEFIYKEEKLDEILPLITGAASLAGGAMKLAGGVASGLGSVAKGVGKGVGAAAKGIGKAVGATGNAVANKINGNDEDPIEIDQAKDQMLKPGNTIELPTSGTGGKGQFKVTRVQGDEVEIENPNKNNPTEPDKIVYKKGDLKKSIQA